jgi:hypothetical protein
MKLKTKVKIILKVLTAIPTAKLNKRQVSVMIEHIEQLEKLLKTL